MTLRENCALIPDDRDRIPAVTARGRLAMISKIGHRDAMYPLRTKSFEIFPPASPVSSDLRPIPCCVGKDINNDS